MNGRIASVGVFALLLGFAWTARPGADDAPANQPATELKSIAVVDVARVLRGHRQFNQRLSQIREEIAEGQQKLTLRQVEIESNQRKLQELTPGTKEFEQTQQLLARLQTELQRTATELQQQLVAKELELFVDIYDQIAAAVGQYAETHGIRLVLRSHETPADPADRASVLATVNREVVYQQDLDITPAIIEQLNDQ